MEGLKILIIEDELLFAEEMASQLKEWGYRVTGIAANSQKAFSSFLTSKPDLMLVDIELIGSEHNGIEIVEKLTNLVKIPIVYLSLVRDPVLLERAKATNPAYYLVKPCNALQLRVGLDHAINNFAQQQPTDTQHSLAYHEPMPEDAFMFEDRVFAKVGNKHVRLLMDDIVRLESVGGGNLTFIYTDRERLSISAGIGSIMSQLKKSSLIRVHRSHAINKNRCSAVNKGAVFVEQDGEQVEVSIGKTYREKLISSLPYLKSD